MPLYIANIWLSQCKSMEYSCKSSWQVQSNDHKFQATVTFAHINLFTIKSEHTLYTAAEYINMNVHKRLYTLQMFHKRLVHLSTCIHMSIHSATVGLTCFSFCCISAYPLPRLAAVSCVASRRDRCLIWAWVPAAAMGV